MVVVVYDKIPPSDKEKGNVVCDMALSLIESIVSADEENGGDGDDDDGSSSTCATQSLPDRRWSWIRCHNRRRGADAAVVPLIQGGRLRIVL